MDKQIDNRTLVYLKEALDDDRYTADTKLRTGQVGIVTGFRGADEDDTWYWVTWYAGPLAKEAAQCHPGKELGVVKLHAPFHE